MNVISVVRNLVIRAGADFSQMKREMQKANKDLKDFGGKMKSAVSGIAAALGSIAIGAGIKSVVDDAMKVEASMQQINRMMGNSSAEFAKWAKESAGAFNISRSEAIRYGATFANLISTFSTDTAKTAEYTKQLLKASSVITAATGRDMEDVMERIRSGMLGNTEAIEDLGVNVQVSMMESTDAFKKFANGKSWDQLDFKTKQQIMLFGILEQATKKYGDELAINTASKLGAFTTQLKNARLSLGQAFLPILNVILPSLTAFATSLSRVMSLVAQFSQALFGKSIVSQVKSTNAQAAAVSGLGDAYTEAGKKASKAAGSVAGFDETNALSSGSSGDGATDGTDAEKSAGVGGGAADLVSGGIGDATDEVSSSVQEMAKKVKKAFGDMTDFITQHKEIIIAALGGIATAFGALAVIKGVSVLLQAIGTALTAIFSPIGLLVIALAALAAAFIYLWRNNEDFKTGVIALWEEVKVGLLAAWDWISTTAIAIWDGLKKFWAKNGDDIKEGLSTAWEGIKTFLKSTFEFLDTIARAIWGGMQAFWSKWGSDISAVFQSIWQTISSLMVDIFSFISEKLKVLAAFWNEYWPAIAQALINAWNLIWLFLEPIVDGLIKGLIAAWDPLKKAIEDVWEAIKQIINGALDIIMGAVKVFIGVFTLDWKTTWDGIKDIVSGVWDLIVGVIKLAWSAILAAAKVGAGFVGGFLEAFWSSMRDLAANLFGALGDIVKNTWDGIVNTIKNSINFITGAINSFIDKFNGIKISVPAVDIPMVGKVGGFEIGMPQIPRLPMLKRGGIVDGATNMGNYIAGEAGPEMIVPLENTSFVDKVAGALGNAVLTAMQFGSSGGNKQSGDINLIIDGVSLARVIAPYITKENTRVGGGMIRTT